MAQKLYTEDYIQDIADAIREKNGEVTKYTVQDMGAAVRLITTGLLATEVTVNTSTYTTE